MTAASVYYVICLLMGISEKGERREGKVTWKFPPLPVKIGEKYDKVNKRDVPCLRYPLIS